VWEEKVRACGVRGIRRTEVVKKGPGGLGIVTSARKEGKSLCLREMTPVVRSKRKTLADGAEKKKGANGKPDAVVQWLSRGGVSGEETR